MRRHAPAGRHAELQSSRDAGLHAGRQRARRPAPLVCGLLAGLLAACTQAPEPVVIQYGVLDGQEPVVRVYLRSLGDPGALAVEGKGGLRVTAGGTDFATQDPYPLTRQDQPVRLRPRDGIFTIGGHTFAGELEWRQGRAVNRVTLENYVLGVLRGELPLKQVPRQAAAAQAIAVRSYTLHYLAQAREEFDVDDTTLYQRYVGLAYAPDDASLRAGVHATTGLYLAYRGDPLKAYYHSTCGGHTTDVPTGLQREPIGAMPGVKCEFCSGTKYWRWETRLSDGEILKAAAVTGPLRSFAFLAPGAGGRARQVRVDTGRTTLVPATEFRLAIGPSKLRSTRILEVERVKGGYRVRGAGWGHGVGLCQMGAIGMAKKGKSGREIASYYYPGATIRRAY